MHSETPCETIQVTTRGSTSARFQEPRVWIPTGGMGLSLVSVVSFQAEFPVTDRKLVHGSPTNCGVTECDHESSKRRRPRPTRGCRATEKRRSVGSQEDKYGPPIKIVSITKYIPDIWSKKTKRDYWAHQGKSFWRYQIMPEMRNFSTLRCNNKSTKNY